MNCCTRTSSTIELSLAFTCGSTISQFPQSTAPRQMKVDEDILPRGHDEDAFAILRAFASLW